MSKINKRKKSKYPGLQKNLYSRIKQQFFDIDYVDKLSEDEKAWLNNFMNAWLGANTKDNPTVPEHEDKRKCWQMNNHRNNDVYSIKLVTGQLTDIEIMPEEIVEYEDSLIEKIDETLKYDKISKEID